MATRNKGKPRIPSPPLTVHIGGVYIVKRLNGELASAKIIEKRYNSVKNQQEFFVQYIHLHERLNQWLPPSRILKSAKVPIGKSLNSDRSERLPSKKQQKNKVSAVGEESLEASSSTKGVPAELLCQVKYIESIQFGIYELDTWYPSPFPDDFGKEPKLFMCEYCLKYMKRERTYRYHLGSCSWRHPPGKQVYHKGTLTVYEVNPSKNMIYCQNLSLLGKLFMNNKPAVYYIVSYVFYVLCEIDKHGSHVVGYFSKEKSSEDKNLAALLILPPFQMKGYGKLLISFSYELSKLEGVIGGPETPLSDLGSLSYRSYWTYAVLTTIRQLRGQVTIDELSRMTSMKGEDILSTLESLNMLKYWLRPNILCVTPNFINERLHNSRYKMPPFIVNKSEILFTPRKKVTRQRASNSTK